MKNTIKIIAILRILKAILLIGLIFFNCRCSTIHLVSFSNPDISTFIGSWKGEENNGNSKRIWTHLRSSDGTYTQVFTENINNEQIRNINSGFWWIQDGTYYEKSSNGINAPDIYAYEIVSDNQILFSNILIDYQFTNERIAQTYLKLMSLKK